MTSSALPEMPVPDAPVPDAPVPDRFAGCVPELTRRGLLPESCLAVFVVGSAVRGWDNGASDFDICVVTSRRRAAENGMEIPVPLDPPSVPVASLTVDGRRWELKYWLDSQLEQILAKVSWSVFSQRLVNSQLLRDVEEVLLERLPFCVPLLGADWIRRLQGELSASAFAAFVVTRSLTMTEACVEEAIGQLDAGDLESAVISTKKAFGHAVDGLLESLGEFGNLTPKWRARRFRAAAPEAMTFDDYWAIETMRDYDAEQPGTWVRQVAWTCKQLATYTEVPG